MIDSHCHLTACPLPDAIDPALEAIISVGITAQNAEETLELANAHPRVWAVLGIHPNHADEATPEARATVERLLGDPKVVGVGETGFDLYWDKVALEQQRDAFFWQAALAGQYQKPLILHVRDKQGQEEASLIAARALKEAGHTQGVLHCFNGHPSLLRAALDLGWFVSFAGNLTYKNARDVHVAAREAPLERLLVETDSPYLAPVPKRGKPNLPAYVRHTAAFLAQLRGVELETLEPVLDENARAVYRLPGA